MANGLIQIRVDEELKNDATKIYEQLGIDLPTASEKLLSAVSKMNRISEENGNSKMTLEEIDREIANSRNKKEK